MTKNEIKSMVAQHTALRDRVYRLFTHHYDEMSDEERDRWFKELRLQNQILDWLAEQKPDAE